MARTLALALALLLGILVAVPSASALGGKRPHRTHHVSAAVPYVAPWQTGFDKYSTQIYVPSAFSTNAQQMVIPVGQWWRIIYLNATFVTGATVANRTMEALVRDTNGTNVFEAHAAASQAASLNGTYLFGPNLTAYANTGENLGMMAVASMPDLLWPPSFTVRLFVSNIKAGDAWGTNLSFAVEIYSEDYAGHFVPTATPIPLIP